MAIPHTETAFISLITFSMCPSLPFNQAQIWTVVMGNLLGAGTGEGGRGMCSVSELRVSLEPTGTAALGSKERLVLWEPGTLGWKPGHKRQSPDPQLSGLGSGHPVFLECQEAGPNYISPWEITMSRPGEGPR